MPNRQECILFASIFALATLVFVTIAHAQAPLESLAAKLRSVDAIRRVEILGIPPRILTRTRVTPEMLERVYSYKFVVHDLRGSAYASSLTTAVETTTVEHTTDEADIRWAVIFFGPHNSRIASIYLDGSRQKGAVNTQAVTFRGGLGEWLQANFSNAFR